MGKDNDFTRLPNNGTIPRVTYPPRQAGAGSEENTSKEKVEITAGVQLTAVLDWLLALSAFKLGTPTHGSTSSG